MANQKAGTRLRDALRAAGVKWPGLRDWLRDELGDYIPSEATLRRMEKSADGSDWDPLIAGRIAMLLDVPLRDLSEIASDRLGRVKEVALATSTCMAA